MCAGRCRSPKPPTTGGVTSSAVKRLKYLEHENTTLKRLLAEAELEKVALKEIAKGNF